MLNKMRNNKKGFTLIELMIVVAIIGILAAIAIPQFASYRQRAYDAESKSALKNIATAEEDYYVQYNTYTGSTAALTGFNPGDEVTVAISSDDFNQNFTATAVHDKNPGVTWTYESDNGGLQEQP